MAEFLSKNMVSLEAFESNVIKTWGDKGHAWLKALPSIIGSLETFWRLKELVPVNNLSYNYVMTGYQGLTAIVLKISCDQSYFNNEQRALALYAGCGSIRLLDSNPEYNALLLERALPGTSLTPFFPAHDDEALKITVTIMEQLHAAPLVGTIDAPTLQDWFRDLFNPPDNVHLPHVQKAQELARYLYTTQAKPVLLHGDLHHNNIVLNQDVWVAIDPKGLLGEPAFEVCSFLKNPHSEVLQDKKLTLRRIKLFSQYLALDQDRLIGWLYAQTVLDACWNIKEGQDAKIAFAPVELVAVLL